MSEALAVARQLAGRIGALFPAQPVPPYPPEMGLDPVGVDEYAPFAGTPWNEVPAAALTWTGYDISPGIGFRIHESPHMWNYHVPGFMTGSLLHESEHDIIDGFVWQLREVSPPPPDRARGDGPWWGGDAPFANYSDEQLACVAQFLRFVREHGAECQWGYLWELTDDRAFAPWFELDPTA